MAPVRPLIAVVDDEESVRRALARAHDQATLREQCLADGAVAYLAKPLQRERLVGLINDAIRLRSAS